MISYLIRFGRWITYPYRWLRYGSAIKADETVVLFPQSGFQNPSGGWTIPVHAWVVELERGSISRRIGRRALLELLDVAGVVDDPVDSSIFRRRVIWFTADREINKKLTVKIGDDTFKSPRSGRNGHVEFAVHYSGPAPAGSVLKCTVTDIAESSAQPVGSVQLVPQHGISVISDIDDTIKISNVTRRRELVKGIFFDKYKQTPGFAEFYQALYERDVCFHYVSSSPWQLYPSLAPFLARYFPYGSISQRYFYVGDQSFVRFFRSSMNYKIITVSHLLQRYPQRRFVLIGDSGEKDPEIYTRIACQFGAQVVAILIRDIADDSELMASAHSESQPLHSRGQCENESRWELIRSQLPDDFPDSAFRVFKHPAELGNPDDWLASIVAECI